MKPTALFIPNSVDINDYETINQPMLVVFDADTRELLWGVDVVAKSLEDLELMQKLSIVYTSNLEVGKNEMRNGILLHGTTYENVVWTDEIDEKEKARSAATERAI